MSTYNIAVTVGPNIFRTKDHKSEDILSTGVFTEILIYMMKEFGYLFEDKSRVDDQNIVHGEVGSLGNADYELLGDKNTERRRATISGVLEINVTS